MAFDQINTLPDPEALACHAAEWLLETVAQAAGPVSIALAGGSTPRRLYEILAEPACRERMRWHDVHWFWGDERYVPHTHARSNYRMACDTLLSRAPIPAANIHPMPTTSTSPEDAAAAYARLLVDHYGTSKLDPSRPFFDIVLLGLGTDGHTASLFPHTTALAENRRWAVAVNADQPEPRITLTYPLLNSCRHAVFLVTGSDKQAVLERLARGDPALPASGIRPTAGQLHCFTDTSAQGDMP